MGYPQALVKFGEDSFTIDEIQSVMDEQTGGHRVIALAQLIDQ